MPNCPQSTRLASTSGIDQCFNSAEKIRLKCDRKNKSNFIGPLIGVNENRGLCPARLKAAGPYPHPVLKVMGYPTRYYRGALTPATASTHLYVTGEVISRFCNEMFDINVSIERKY